MEDFFGRFGGIFWEDDLFVKILVFFSRFCLKARRKEGRKISILRSASASISHLKIAKTPESL